MAGPPHAPCRVGCGGGGRQGQPPGAASGVHVPPAGTSEYTPSATVAAQRLPRPAAVSCSSARASPPPLDPGAAQILQWAGPTIAGPTGPPGGGSSLPAAAPQADGSWPATRWADPPSSSAGLPPHLAHERAARGWGGGVVAQAGRAGGRTGGWVGGQAVVGWVGGSWGHGEGGGSAEGLGAGDGGTGHTCQRVSSEAPASHPRPRLPLPAIRQSKLPTPNPTPPQPTPRRTQLHLLTQRCLLGLA